VAVVWFVVILQRVARMPRGPTLTFRVDKYSLMRDIANSQANPSSPGLQFKTPPLVRRSFFFLLLVHLNPWVI
jgi:hypothetical protein